MHLGLRPGPPPETVPEPSLPWWPFLVLGGLLAVVFIIRFRSRRVMLSPEKVLERAIEQAKESTSELIGRYLALQQGIRSYLGNRVDAHWLALTSLEAECQWEQLFSANDQVHAQILASAWKTAEYLQYGQGTVQENDLEQLIDAAQTLLARQTKMAATRAANLSKNLGKVAEYTKKDTEREPEKRMR